MNTVESFRATIWLGLLYIAVLCQAAIWSSNTMALWTIIATAGGAYLTQVLNTTWCVMCDNGTPVNDAARYYIAAMIAWLVTLVLGVAALLLLVL